MMYVIHAPHGFVKRHGSFPSFLDISPCVAVCFHQGLGTLVFCYNKKWLSLYITSSSNHNNHGEDSDLWKKIACEKDYKYP